MTDRTAVVVVNYNAGEFIVDCLRSVIDAAPGAEIVVVDNASTDGSGERLRETFPSVRLVRNDRNVGFAGAANQGVRATSTPYVFLLNPDSVVHSGAVRGLERVLDEHPRAAAVGADVRNPDGSAQPTKRAFPGPWQSALHGLVGPFWPNNPGTRAYTLADESFTDARAVDWVAATAVALRREAFDRVDGFDESFFFFAEDVDLCKRLADAGWEVWFAPGAEVFHEWGGSWTQQPLRFLWMHHRNLFRYVTKHRRGAWVLTYPIVVAGILVRFALMTIRWLVTRRSVPGHRGAARLDG